MDSPPKPQVDRSTLKLLLRLILAAIVGGLSGIVLGIAVTVGFVYYETHKPHNPRDPTRGSLSPLAGVIIVPGGFVLGVTSAVSIVAAIEAGKRL